ncbi:MAG: hypothetical protein VBE63_10705 [Lamprobacter sp.]|uniref:hypothetical protein n=1 Tax=Lamprobacter sp. TaxID=3100796 RepID=UPI002B260FC2|nr:hypothetical protein [Lamprobacter sp.]MEA3640403.1 hypothetical protein [Lamprobacter sp.]
MTDQALNSTQNMLPIEDFAKAKQIETAKCIQMVRDGFYDGRLINGAWYVSKLELDARQDQGRGRQSRSRSRPKPSRHAKAQPRRMGGLPDMSIFFILMALFSLILSLILVLTYWPGSTAYPDHIDLDAYREPILWGLGGVLAASLFAALARVIHDLSLLVGATVKRRD